jgi:dienelactone hydrolase
MLLLSACGGNSKTTTVENNEPIDNGSNTILNQEPYKVGVQRLVFTNERTVDTLSEEMKTILSMSAGDSRELMVKIWYPADENQEFVESHNYGFHTENSPVPVDPNDEYYQEYLTGFLEEAVVSRSFYNAIPIKNTMYPVVFYSHGYGGSVEENEQYYQSLTEQGYVVVSIGHSQEARYVTVNNEVGIPFNLDMAEHAFSRLEPELSKVLTDEEKADLFTLPLGSEINNDLLRKHYYEAAEVNINSLEHINLWVEDTQFVLEQLQEINSGAIESNLQGIFDLSKIAATGHSFGGATARHFCNREINCLASINMDGSSFARYGDNITKPYLVYRGEAEARVQALVRNDVQMSDLDRQQAIDKTELDAYIVNHADINAALDDLYILRLKTDHMGFILGWLDLHDDGLGKSVLHSILEESSLHFLNRYLKPDQKLDSEQKLCLKISESDALVSPFHNVCG